MNIPSTPQQFYLQKTQPSLKRKATHYTTCHLPTPAATTHTTTTACLCTCPACHLPATTTTHLPATAGSHHSLPPLGAAGCRLRPTPLHTAFPTQCRTPHCHTHHCHTATSSHATHLSASACPSCTFVPAAWRTRILPPACSVWISTAGSACHAVTLVQCSEVFLHSRLAAKEKESAKETSATWSDHLMNSILVTTGGSVGLCMGVLSVSLCYGQTS